MKPTITILALLVSLPVRAVEHKPTITKREIALDVALVATSVFDAYTTNRMLQSHYIRETNPLMLPFVRTPAIYLSTQIDTGLPLALAYKLRAHRRVSLALKLYAAYSAGEHVKLGIHNERLYDKYR